MNNTPSYNELIDAAVQQAVESHAISELEMAADQVLAVFRASRYSPIDGDYVRARENFRVEILRSIALRQYSGDEKKANGFCSGYLFFTDTVGSACKPGFWEDEDAWYAGRDANPDFALHVSATKMANAAFAAKFKISAPATQKGYVYWIKQYCKAKMEIAQ
uniref:hypothetical protein n=1 Tax=Xanthomonas albilineans TaxID=29447 RepID=UPI0027DE1D9F|nr:hypothetical protein [Xanthomonas albilineans]